MQKTAKGTLTGLCTVTAYLGGMFTPLVYILVIFGAADYVTGIASAAKNGKLSSNTAFWGFIRKLGYFVLIGVAFLFDLVIMETTAYIGIDLDWPEVFGIMSVCYLISAEAISILENLSKLNVTIPFLTKALTVYRDRISKSADDFTA